MTTYEEKKSIALICLSALIRRPEHVEKVAEVVATMGRGIGTYWLQELQGAVNFPMPDGEEISRIQQSGLTRNQARRVIEIRESMSKLDAEAKEIIKPTPDELSNSADCYADNSHGYLAEIISDSWGSWEDILEDRISAAEEEVNDQIAAEEEEDEDAERS